MNEEIIKEYEADGLTIVWKPGKCIHSEVCWKTLPGVYKPEEKPWIQPAGATKAQLVEQIDRCPSGALTYRLHGSEIQSGTSEFTVSIGRIEIQEDGPAKVKGPVEVIHKGQPELVNRDVFLCRCGASENKPYCDGSHRKAGFRDSD